MHEPICERSWRNRKCCKLLPLDSLIESDQDLAGNESSEPTPSPFRIQTEKAECLEQTSISLQHDNDVSMVL